MFSRTKRFPYDAQNPIFAKQMQELLGGQWGELSVMNGYLFQGWNCRGPAKYRDMIMNIATEEIGHVEIIATMIARLLEKSPVQAEEAVAGDGSGVLGSIMGGDGDGEEKILNAMNPQHYIVAGLGATPRDSMGNPWSASYIISSGNLLADFRYNVTAESQGRLQASRLYNLTGDAGVRDMLAFLIARDHMHQNKWLAAIEELKADGIDETPVPVTFPLQNEHQQFVRLPVYELLRGRGERARPLGEWPCPRRRGQFRVRAKPAGSWPRHERAARGGPEGLRHPQAADAARFFLTPERGIEQGAGAVARRSGPRPFARGAAPKGVPVILDVG